MHAEVGLGKTWYLPPPPKQQQQQQQQNKQNKNKQKQKQQQISCLTNYFLYKGARRDSQA